MHCQAFKLSKRLTVTLQQLIKLWKLINLKNVKQISSKKAIGQRQSDHKSEYYNIKLLKEQSGDFIENFFKSFEPN